ncbi:hypothetical protein [Paracoccus aerodenitrificans]|uniref:hypothetical protein n=1 Tax=Paracoccus aerodenitrificans TaxID=3017781 RepID=UPI0022F0F69F|nr:hypothetical protein [Paracoccus aerodenitrificans]WBU63317.1 hypothetical protein PAE61_13240 [Paracoccus aerodenitrificans]
MIKTAVIACVAIGTLAACNITPEQYESDPVLADSPMGPVTCQIYTHEQVTWDRSIARPEQMDVKTADAICWEEGRQILEGKEPVYAPTVTAVAPL